MHNIAVADDEEDEVGDEGEKSAEPEEAPEMERLSFGLALVACIAAAAFHSLYSFLIKFSERYFHVGVVALSRYSVQFILTSLLLCAKRKSPLGPPQARLFLVGRGLLGLSSQGCHMLAVSLLPFADAVSLHMVSPVITALLAPIFLGESLTCTAVVAAAVASAGCALIVHSSPSRGRGPASSADGSFLWSIGGVPIALCGAFLASCTYMVIRRIMRTAQFQLLPEAVVWAYAGTSLVALGIAWPAWAGHVKLDAPGFAWLGLLGVGIVSFLEQQLVTTGFQRISAGLGTLVLTLEMAFAFLLSLTLLQESLHALKAIGALAIATAAAVLSLQQMAQEKAGLSKKVEEEARLEDFTSQEAPENGHAAV